jgi:hypothetical protein
LAASVSVRGKRYARGTLLAAPRATSATGRFDRQWNDMTGTP